MKMVLKVIEREGKRTQFRPKLKRGVNNLNLSEKYTHLHMVSYERNNRIIRKFYALKDGETL
mgnify:FL=1